jgi:hypothetical protein
MAREGCSRDVDGYDRLGAGPKMFDSLESMSKAPVTCDDLGREAQGLLADGHGHVARLLVDRLAETCLNARDLCPRHDTCQMAVARLAKSLHTPTD